MNSAPQAFLMVRSVPEGVTVERRGVDETIRLEKDSVLLGRSPDKSGEPKPDIEVNDHWISRKHATIFYDHESNSFMLRDEGSTHGTFLDGEALEQNEVRPLATEHPVVIGLARPKPENAIRIRLKFWVGTLTRRQDELTVDVENRRVYLGDEEVPLTKREFDVLRVLYRNLGAFCGWEIIGDSIWGKDGYEESNVRRHISSLREEIGKKASPGKSGFDYVMGEPGRGYKLVLD